MEKDEKKKDFKDQLAEMVSNRIKQEDNLLNLNEMEEVEGGICVAGCLWSRIIGLDQAEEDKTLQP